MLTELPLLHNSCKSCPTNACTGTPECCAYIAHKLILKSLENRYQSDKEVIRDVNLCLKQMRAP